ncbi:glycosyltransferase family 2 protein [Clostridium felsineum]|uniref:glycosyltransferase family 2 protein n=1 Tax=Clostridium felsineum TaxID=36839 RepID=UPI00098C2FC8|nr:glycosyltransferase family 2 protein [Clostridium felsineum]
MNSDIKIKVSVLIITYNQSRFIEKAIKSALLQKTTFKYEIIVMDDSSKDGTLNIANKYREKYPDQIKVFSNINNLGITKNYKEGFKKCTGEYIAILEGDDYWISKRKLQLESDFLDRHTGYSAVFNRFVVYNTIYNTKQTQAWNNSFSYETITTKKLTLGNVIGNFSACMYRKVCVNKLKESLYDMVVYDWMFNIAISEKGPIAYLPQICSVYRVHSKGKWSGKSERSKILMTLKLIDKYNKFLGFKYDNNFKIVKKVIYNELIKS